MLIEIGVRTALNHKGDHPPFGKGDAAFVSAEPVTYLNSLRERPDISVFDVCEQHAPLKSARARNAFVALVIMQMRVTFIRTLQCLAACQRLVVRHVGD